MKIRITDISEPNGRTVVAFKSELGRACAEWRDRDPPTRRTYHVELDTNHEFRVGVDCVIIDADTFLLTGAEGDQVYLDGVIGSKFDEDLYEFVIGHDLFQAHITGEIATGTWVRLGPVVLQVWDIHI